MNKEIDEMTPEQIDETLEILIYEANLLEKKYDYVSDLSFLPRMKDRYDKMCRETAYAYILTTFNKLTMKKYNVKINLLGGMDVTRGRFSDREK